MTKEKQYKFLPCENRQLLSQEKEIPIIQFPRVFLMKYSHDIISFLSPLFSLEFRRRREMKELTRKKGYWTITRLRTAFNGYYQCSFILFIFHLAGILYFTSWTNRLLTYDFLWKLWKFLSNRKRKRYRHNLEPGGEDPASYSETNFQAYR